MSKENQMSDEKGSSVERLREVGREDPLGSTTELISPDVPPGVRRRDFLMRSAVVGAAAVMTGCNVLTSERTEQAIATIPHFPQKPASAPALATDLNVVKKGQGPVMTVLGEFYK